jgi:hypothetical protein
MHVLAGAGGVSKHQRVFMIRLSILHGLQVAMASTTTAHGLTSKVNQVEA